MKNQTLSPPLLHKIDAYWRTANYLSVGQIYLYDNPLLKTPLQLSHVKPLVVGHWGTTPGQNFIYVHLNRVIKKYDLNILYIAESGHDDPAIVGNVYLSDQNSDHKDGNDARRCVVEAHIEGHQPLAVTSHASTLNQSVEGAAEKLTHLIDHTLGRLEHQQSHRTDPPLSRSL